jgi:hypothetical protein
MQGAVAQGQGRRSSRRKAMAHRGRGSTVVGGRVGRAGVGAAWQQEEG